MSGVVYRVVNEEDLERYFPELFSGRSVDGCLPRIRIEFNVGEALTLVSSDLCARIIIELPNADGTFNGAGQVVCTVYDSAFVIATLEQDAGAPVHLISEIDYPEGALFWILGLLTKAGMTDLTMKAIDEKDYIPKEMHLALGY
ncbi:hypothetical protein HGA91_05595 [candidate division WWE3 bacterium]|nr:hypothetical protein [candidate division WWE3 bacterium]